MAHQEKLGKIGKEGFNIIGQFYYPTKRMERQPQEKIAQKSYPSWRSFAAPKTIDSNQAAKRYGGVLIFDWQRKYHK